MTNLHSKQTRVLEWALALLIVIGAGSVWNSASIRSASGSQLHQNDQGLSNRESGQMGYGDCGSEGGD